MHKKLASELTSLAHSILQMKNKENVFSLKKKAHEIYEKLSVLAYVEEYIDYTPQATQTKQELINNINKIEKQKKESEKKIQTKKLEKEKKSTSENIIEQPFDEIENTIFEKSDNKKDENQNKTLEDELKDTISVDITSDMFSIPDDNKPTLNDRLQKNIEIGLNDRIAFVKHLFNNNTSEFNKIISQLNTLRSEKEAKVFISKKIKPNYNWNEKEEYEIRFLQIIERKFL